MKNQACAAAAMAMLFFSIPIQSVAQQWPEKPVHILVPFPPGGGTDIQARLLSTEFQKSTGQSFIIDNRTGASGLIAAQLAVDSPPDGYTILFTSGSISVVVTLYSDLVRFDVNRDLQPISWISSTPLVLAVHPSVPAHSVKELVALAKRKPGGMNVGGNTAGSTAHLSAEMLNQVAGIKATIVNFRGGGPAVIALVSGELDFGFVTAPSIMPFLNSGKAKGLAVTTPKRSSVLPDLPTMDSMYPGFTADNWYAMFYPKGTPKAIVDKMNAEIKKAANTPELKAFYPKQALDVVASSPEELSALLNREVPKYAKVINDAHIRVQ
jgi:tripartite-type tricarboxylate transporter receptor subunit TctC